MGTFTFDTEFIEDGETIDLISIGIVNIETGETLYMVSSEYDPSKANDWVKTNVLNKIGEDERRYRKSQIAMAVLRFCGNDPEFWAYYASYDWVAFCQLFGAMSDLPKNYPQICFDLKQEILRQVKSGILDEKSIPPDPENAHNALDDALWNARVYTALFPEAKSFLESLSSSHIKKEEQFRPKDDSWLRHSRDAE